MIEQLKTIREALNECPNNVVKAHIALAQLEAMVKENKPVAEAVAMPGTSGFTMAALRTRWDQTLRHQVTQQPQAEAVPHLFELWWAEYMPDATQARAWAAWTAAPRAEGVGIAAPQQAEAVPSDVVRDALELAEEALGWHAAGFCEDSMPQLTVEALHAIRAAIAQQKGASHE